jgi:hypothetical protein
MLNIPSVLIEAVIKQVKHQYQLNYGLLEPEYASILEWSGNLAIELIANSDALYHNVDHTIMVTLAGQQILRGKHLRDGGIEPDDWLHFIIALLFHDIGYVRGICSSDRENVYDTGVNGEMIELPPGSTDAALTPFHVDRGKLFIYERFENRQYIKADKIAGYIEMTRFPVPDKPEYQDTKNLPGLLRAADFIGQLGDPNYLRKTPALFYEFQETGLNAKNGYTSPDDMRKRYARFFWDVVNPYIKDAMQYLSLTQEGKQWMANLYSHVFSIEHLHMLRI